MGIRFYHLTRQSLEEALPRLLDKVLAAGHRVQLHASEESLAETLDRALWTWREESFLPHAIAGRADDTLQSILITGEHDNKNDADVLVLLDGADSPAIEEFPLVLMLFDGRHNHVVEKCRSHWKAWQEKGAEITYWQQSESGAWEQKA